MFVSLLIISHSLTERGVEGEILREDPTLSVPEFYFTPEQVQRITRLADIDDFPVLEPDDIIFKDEDTGLEVYHHRWQQAFLLLSVRSRGFGTRVMHLFVQPGRSKWAYSTNKRILTHTSTWDGRGSYSPDMTRDTQTVMDALAKYGEELRTRHLH